MKLNPRPLTVLAISLAISSSVLAQYVWLDENGHKQYSDQTPPASVPKSRILKYDGKPMDQQNSTSSATTKSEEKIKQPETLSDKELAYKKRREELIAKEKKEQEEAKAAAVNNENCRRMKEYKRTLETGQRVSQTDASGNMGFISDEKRAQELNEVQRSLSGCGN